jgi:hypothetical protein
MPHPAMQFPPLQTSPVAHEAPSATFVHAVVLVLLAPG